MYNEPDWSDLTLAELLGKALEFGNKAYSSSLSTYAFLERAMEAGNKYSTSTMEMADLAKKTRQAFQLLSDVNHDLERLVPPAPSPQSKEKKK
jgi:hypothetical protein